MFIIEIGIVLMAIGVILTAYGYNLKLPGYSRKKLLEGESVSAQMHHRKFCGEAFMQAGVITMAITALIVFLVLGINLEVETVTVNPKEVNVMLAQNKTVVMVDGEVYVFNGYHNHIRRVYIKQGFNSYGRQCEDDALVIEDQDQWEVLGR